MPRGDDWEFHHCQKKLTLEFEPIVASLAANSSLGVARRCFSIEGDDCTAAISGEGCSPMSLTASNQGSMLHVGFGQSDILG